LSDKVQACADNRKCCAIIFPDGNEDRSEASPDHAGIAQTQAAGEEPRQTWDVSGLVRVLHNAECTRASRWPRRPATQAFWCGMPAAAM